MGTRPRWGPKHKGGFRDGGKRHGRGGGWGHMLPKGGRKGHRLKLKMIAIW